MKFLSILIILLCVDTFSQNNFTTEWESPVVNRVGLTQSESSNNIPEIVLFEPPMMKIYDGATKSLKYQYNNSDEGYFQWGVDLYNQNTFDADHDGINEIIVTKNITSGTSTFKVLNGATGSVMYQESGNVIYSNTFIIDVDGDNYLELVLTSYVYPNSTQWKMKIISTTATPISVEPNSKVSTEYKLGQNYPNPFNPATTVEYSVSKEADVSLNIFNELGQLVKNVSEGNKKAGDYKIQLDCTDFASGVYFYQLVVDGSPEAKKMVLVK
jgi:hypothetical protein